MGPTILRPGQRLIVPGVRVFQPSMATPTQWWLSGGISAANCIAAYAPKGAADLASSYMNLANPGTYNAAPGVAPTFATADGWTFNGASQYLTTGIVPAAGWSIAIRYSNMTGGGGMAGARIAFANSQFYTLINRFAYGNANNDTWLGVAGATIVMAAGAAYVDSVLKGTLSGTFGGTVPSIFIGAINTNGTVSIYGSVKIQAISIYNISIASYVSALTTAINAL